MAFHKRHVPAILAGKAEVAQGFVAEMQESQVWRRIADTTGAEPTLIHVGIVRYLEATSHWGVPSRKPGSLLWAGFESELARNRCCQILVGSLDPRSGQYDLGFPIRIVNREEFQHGR